MKWKPVAKSIWMYEDSCNVYAVQGSSGIVLINAGTGQWLKNLDELPSDVKAVMCTHFFRDHSAGGAEAARKGIQVYAPYWEQEQFSDPLGLFQRRETFIIYDNVWDLYAPIEPIPVTHWLKDWEKVSIAGLSFLVVQYSLQIRIVLIEGTINNMLKHVEELSPHFQESYLNAVACKDCSHCGKHVFYTHKDHIHKLCKSPWFISPYLQTEDLPDIERLIDFRLANSQ